MVLTLKKSRNNIKNENFIKKLVYNIKLIRDDIKTFIEFISVKTRSDLIADDEQTLLQESKSWLLDIIYYGILLTIIYNTFYGWKGLTNIFLVFSFGTIRWFIFDTIREYRKI